MRLLLQIQLDAGACFLAQPGDRLGFSQPDRQVALGSYLDPTGRRFTQFTDAPVNSTRQQLGDVVTVTSIRLPNVIALAALIDQGQ